MRRLVDSSEATLRWDRIRRMMDDESVVVMLAARLPTGDVGTLVLDLGLNSIFLLASFFLLLYASTMLDAKVEDPSVSSPPSLSSSFPLLVLSSSLTTPTASDAERLLPLRPPVREDASSQSSVYLMAGRSIGLVGGVERQRRGDRRTSGPWALCEESNCCAKALVSDTVRTTLPRRTIRRLPPPPPILLVRLRMPNIFRRLFSRALTELK